ncbi:PIN domain-containing protein [Phenylobacterium sp.]|uniref:PIN domain-containing protein n=1 Tax=Phenylobacterium sp. TaxID=1871053 RepID=UPI003D2B77BD
MAPRYLLDTNVVREILLGEDGHPNVATWLKSVDDHELSISVLTIQEMWKGVAAAQKKGKDKDGSLKAAVEAVEAAFAGRVLSLEADAAKQWGLQVGQQDKHVMDKGIVAIAASHGCTLVTRNVQHTKGLGVEVLDPFKSPPAVYAAQS